LRAQLPGAATPKAETLAMTADVAAITSEAIAASAEVTNAVNTVVAQQVNQEMQERIAAAKRRADERTQDAQEQMKRRLTEAQEKFKDKEFRYDLGIGIGKGLGYGVGMPGEKLADDDPCEFKIVVLQSLTESDPQRGVAAATDWLKPNSGQTPPCRRAALGVIARHAGKAGLPTLLGAAENDPDVKTRARAISLLGTTNDESVIDPLLKFALNSTQTEITEAAMYALGQHTSPRAASALSEVALSATRPIAMRQRAISSISRRQGEPAVDALLGIYDKSQEVEIRKSVIGGLANRKSERAGAKLLDIARTSDNLELRKAAIRAIGQRGGEGAVDNLMNLYDRETNEEIKTQIINSFAYSNDQKVTHKLIEIARNPQTPMERRRRIVMILGGRSKDPEVIKYFEDLLKQ